MSALPTQTYEQEIGSMSADLNEIARLLRELIDAVDRQTRAVALAGHEVSRLHSPQSGTRCDFTLVGEGGPELCGHDVQPRQRIVG